MNYIKKYLGIVWFLLAPIVIYLLVSGAIKYSDVNGNKDINNPLIWVIIITIFTPIAIGLMIFGWFALKGEFDHLPESSAELND